MNSKWRWCLAAGALLSGAAFAQATMPTVIEQHPPAYPRAEEAARHGGAVVVRVTVGADGSVGDAVIGQSTGFAALDAAALTAVKSWRFKPGTDEQGKPIAMSTNFKLTFTPPPYEIDRVSSCAQITAQVAELHATDPLAPLERLPAFGALKELDAVTAEALPAALREDFLASRPDVWRQALAKCESKPGMLFHEAVMEVLSPEKKTGKSRR